MTMPKISIYEFLDILAHIAEDTDLGMPTRHHAAALGADICALIRGMEPVPPPSNVVQFPSTKH